VALLAYGGTVVVGSSKRSREPSGESEITDRAFVDALVEVTPFGWFWFFLSINVASIGVWLHLRDVGEAPFGPLRAEKVCRA